MITLRGGTPGPSLLIENWQEDSRFSCEEFRRVSEREAQRLQASMAQHMDSPFAAVHTTGDLGDWKGVEIAEPKGVSVFLRQIAKGLLDRLHCLMARCGAARRPRVHGQNLQKSDHLFIACVLVRDGDPTTAALRSALGLDGVHQSI